MKGKKKWLTALVAALAAALTVLVEGSPDIVAAAADALLVDESPLPEAEPFGS